MKRSRMPKQVDSLRIFADLAVAVQLGTVLTAMLLICKVAKATTVEQETLDSIEDKRLHVLQEKHIPGDVADVRIHGPFLFGIGEKLHIELPTQVGCLALVVLLCLRHMAAIDTFGQLALENFVRTLHAAGRHLILNWARPQTAKFMQQVGLELHIGRGSFCPQFTAALERAGIA